MSQELSQSLITLKNAIHIANQSLSKIFGSKPDEILTLLEDSQDPSNARDRFVYISNSLMSLANNLSEARLVLINLGQYSTVENWASNEKKKTTARILHEETNGENDTGEERV